MRRNNENKYKTKAPFYYKNMDYITQNNILYITQHIYKAETPEKKNRQPANGGKTIEPEMPPILLLLIVCHLYIFLFSLGTPAK